ncbi:hypothetical protein TH61_08520 [Rufibacter sp. DG15C]|uniref:hypothetical protein n=1 Tax=Rufibacter sp. DG15C TaxID=1379909 RepID=UPI00078EBC34|nr:hypothetical protein [Rufibacter sp. DG15C]AMM51211.1 hypothetical protein TH61_08520 [Rufibacter sp. DG15C]
MENQLSHILSREELYHMVWQEPATQLALRYGIAYQDFKKICDSLAIPLPGSGHWSKVRAGKESPMIALPTDYTGPSETIIQPVLKKQKASLISSIQKEAEADHKSALKVPTRLTDPDKLIIAAKAQFEKKDTYLRDGLLSIYGEYLNIRISPANVNRALRFMDALVKSLKLRGHQIRITHYSTLAVVEGEEFEISLREKLTRIAEKTTRWGSHSYVPSGILIFKIGPNYRSKEWRDGKQLLEDYLSEIIGTLQLKGQKEKEARIQMQIEEKERQERDRIQREHEQLQERELIRFKNLLQQAQQWHQAKILREFIADRASLARINGNTLADLTEWIEWANQKADWYDPTTPNRDDLLNDIDKATLTLQKKSTYYGW